MSPYLSFFFALDNPSRLDASVLTDKLRRDYRQFPQRRWIVPTSHLAYVMAPFLDSEQGVKIDVDEDAGRYSYCSPLSDRTIVQPLAGIALYSVQMGCWLTDLTALIGIKERRRSSQICQTPNHLWHLGEQRTVSVYSFASVFVARAWLRAPQDKITAALADTVWSCGGAVLYPGRTNTSPPRGHTLRGFNELVRLTDGVDAFDTDAFDRALRGYATNVGKPEPMQLFNGKRFKLSHMALFVELTEACTRIIKLTWEAEGSIPSVTSWKEVNGSVTANTGPQSSDDTSGNRVAREEVIELASRGKYRVRRNT